MYDEIRSSLNEYYFSHLPKKVPLIKEAVFKIMDEYYDKHSNESSFKLKAKLYEVIYDTSEPEIIDNVPFYFDTGVLLAPSDGRICHHGFHRLHASAWLYMKKLHVFEDVDPEAYRQYSIDKRSHLYCQTGTYVDLMHTALPLGKVLSKGLSGVLHEIEKIPTDGLDETELEFLACAKSGLHVLHKFQMRFAEKLRERGDTYLAEMAERIPWEAPKTLHEGLEAMAFMRRTFGSIEGVGFNSFGRVDLLLKPLYDADIARGVSEDELFDIISKFLLIWDCALDRTEKVIGGCDYELENTLTLGGCDDFGNPVFNEVTKLFLKARENLNLLYPKMMLRYSKNSPREYMEYLARPIFNGKSFSLLENDEAVIPALVKAGIELKDARNYVVGGCWDLLTPDFGTKFSGEYLSILRPFEWAVHRDFEKIEQHKLMIKPFDNAESFEEIYESYIACIRQLLLRKAGPMSTGSREWYKVNPAPVFSSLMSPCLGKLRDITADGGKYNRECVYFSGFAEVVDSLLAIKKLCFEDKICTPDELFSECRGDWANEILRQRALRAPSFGDGSGESSAMAKRLFDDLYDISRGLPTAYGGEFHIGYNQYTEIIFWGKTTRALPNGRHNGDFLSAGLTPSRLQSSANIQDVLESFRHIDTSKCSGNSSVTLSLPAGHMTSDDLIDLLYAFTGSSFQALQLNAVSLDTLRAAQKDPENYGHIVVRVCGFSAPFVLLSLEYQNEFISRMMTETV